MKTLNLIFVCFLTINLAISWEYHRRQLEEPIETNNLHQQLYWFNQLIDHFNYQSDATWSQRYYVFNDHFNPATGPILLYICGEAECRGISQVSWVAKLAQQTKGLVLSLEHRFYGKSLPFGSSSFELSSLKYLTSEQALRDLAYFMQKMKTSKSHSIGNNPWITIGGSYPGAMAAWFRSKYPHLTIGSISSSGVILAVENFRMFDEQIYISSKKSGDFCVQAIQNVTQYVESQVIGDKKNEFQAEYGAEQLTARQFMFYWSDSIVFQVQYGNRTNFCNSLKDKTLQQAYYVMKSLVKKITPVDYGAFYLGNATYAYNDGRGARSWIYQSCTEFSYFQTYSLDHPMRSRLLSLNFYQKWCNDIFGNQMWPYVVRKNNEFGGLDIKADKLIMTNGEEDPWQWASLQHSNNSKIYAKIIQCENCAHCVDLHAPDAKHDAKDLTNTRSYELEAVQSWIKSYWAQNK